MLLFGVLVFLVFRVVLFVKYVLKLLKLAVLRVPVFLDFANWLILHFGSAPDPKVEGDGHGTRLLVGSLWPGCMLCSRCRVHRVSFK